MDTAIIQIGLAVAVPAAAITAIVWHRRKISKIIDVTEDIDWSKFETDFGDAYFKNPAWRSSLLTPEAYVEMDEMFSTHGSVPIVTGEIKCEAITVGTIGDTELVDVPQKKQ